MPLKLYTVLKHNLLERGKLCGIQSQPAYMIVCMVTWRMSYVFLLSPQRQMGFRYALCGSAANFPNKVEFEMCWFGIASEDDTEGYVLKMRPY